MIEKQPLALTYAPPRYPRHSYTGEGEIVTVRVGREIVGHLTRQGDAVGWDATAPPYTDAGIVRRIVEDALRAGAAQGRSLDEVWREILASVQHEDPVTAPLDGLQG
ncbi:hypothetical protein [Actinopolymorpha pittospori]|uniref:Uncharacterized protein n=1 Tax=Actinopolymorpha pittospori TaxID=648752 RepID=A0A927MZN4_9ACTN|nr:hypothetical protein [Actinopolymorpha pittospori]MBE1606252.1 hypothetical protein [Actinopolymorpha pittospori]